MLEQRDGEERERMTDHTQFQPRTLPCSSLPFRFTLPRSTFLAFCTLSVPLFFHVVHLSHLAFVLFATITDIATRYWVVPVFNKQNTTSFRMTFQCTVEKSNKTLRHEKTPKKKKKPSEE